MNKQTNIPGTEKSADMIAQEIKYLRDAIQPSAGLPGRASDIVKILDNASREDLNALVTAVKMATPRIRMIGSIATELLLGR